MERPALIIATLSILLGTLVPELLGVPVDSEVFFDQKVHPLLESKCYDCHGREEVSGGLVLTNRAGILAGGQRGPAIDLEDPSKSVLLQMINQTDPKQRMPFEQPPLAESERKILEEWAFMGAPYNPDREFPAKVAAGGMTIDDEDRAYWAYQPPRRSTPPAIEDSFVANPIDAFVLAELRHAGLEPNPSASPRKLLRRVHYDLTGLAPSAAEFEAFAAESDQEVAWVAEVADLLASPRFGEKLASLWLDVVRYGETNGFERDSDKPYIWRYRDYVVEAFNRDKPYDRFVVEQLAGDELPDKSFESVVATGFLTLMQRDDEPADPLQAHADMVGDIVDVSSEAFMGSTLGCAKCHDHKGDPIRQADYYSMMAFFDGLQETQFKEPTGSWVDLSVVEKRAAELTEVEAAIAKAWESVDTTQLAPHTLRSEAPKAMLELGKRQSVDWQVARKLPEKLDWTLPSYEGKHFDNLPSPFTNAKESLGDPGYKLNWAGTLFLRQELRLETIPETLFFYAEGRHIEKFTVYFNGDVVYEGLPSLVDGYFFIPFTSDEIASLTTGKNAVALAVQSQKGRQSAFDLGFYYNPVIDLSPNALLVAKPELVESIYGEAFVNRVKAGLDAIRDLQNPRTGEPYLGASEVDSIEPARIHIRGNAHALGKEVPLAFPAVMVPSEQRARPELPEDRFSEYQTHGRRLALGEWLTSPDHPLTARVMVNRLWQHCFGVGIVPSANDFGKFGEKPSNQALLDWLAVEFIESGWSIKHMLRLMLTSSTYRLSVEPNAMAMKADPLNQRHWRHNPRRLTAEEIRDTFLDLTGELRLTAGGPPVLPKMPAAILATSSKPEQVWPETTGPEANRRAIYTHVKRSIKLPMLSVFDSPERDFSCPTRFATTVPTQALTMLNSAFVNECAEKLADRVAQKTDSRTQQIDTAFGLATGRAPEASEQNELLELDLELREQFQLSEADAFNRLCLVILNLNETIYLD